MTSTTDYMTNNIHEACVFLVVLDNHQNGNFLLNANFKQLPLWNEGQNHIIIQFGSTVRYDRNATGNAIIASQYISRRNFQHTSDIVLPYLNSSLTFSTDAWMYASNIMRKRNFFFLSWDIYPSGKTLTKP